MKCKTVDAKSDREPESPLEDSVYDFLYHDGRRIASYLAQFDPSGHMTMVTQGRSANEGRDSSADIDGSVSAVGLAKMRTANREMITRAHAEEIHRVYDPMWANAREFLDQVESRGLLQRALNDAQVGQLVLLRGALSIYDLEVLGGIWGAPSIQKLMRRGLPQIPTMEKGVKQTPEMRAIQRALKEAKDEAESNLDLFAEMIPHLPHTIQATISNSLGSAVWCCLERGGMSVAASDITLKHGLLIPGEWAVVGILDALPDEDVTAELRKQTSDGDEMLAKLFESLAPVVRALLGRPKSAYGITPLLVFRQLETALPARQR